jgi:predicted negative regulator of RcsB-dependent stress response
MASHLDLEEQEQLDQIKHFWKRWGDLITWLLIAVLAAYAGWNGWQWWQKRNAAQAAVLFGTVEQAAQQADLVLLERSLGDIQSRFASTTLAHHAALLAARTFESKGESDKAKAALQWVAKQGGDDGLVALAWWRLAGLQLESKDWEGAKASLSGRKVPTAFQSLFDERLGDLASLQGQPEQAKDWYQKAWQGATAGSDHRRWLEIKLAPLGVTPKEKS